MSNAIDTGILHAAIDTAAAEGRLTPELSSEILATLRGETQKHVGQTMAADDDFHAACYRAADGASRAARGLPIRGLQTNQGNPLK